MVGIKVGGTNSGLEVGWAVAVVVGLGTEVRVGVAVRVWLGTGVAVALTVVVDDGRGNGVAVTACPHARIDKLISRKITTRKRFFMLTHSA
jgi:hypothetical protein